MSVDNIKNFIKAELSGWHKYEVIAISSVFIFIFVNAFIFKDSVIAVVSAVCGILYSAIAGKGKISCYLFGLTGTLCYSWLSFDNGLWGNLVLYMGYYFPMQIYGILEWRKHLESTTKEIVKVKMNKKKASMFLVFAVISCLCAVFIIKYLKGSSPFFDGVTTVLSVFGMYLTVKRSIEQWIVWMIVNGLSAIMWFNIVLHGAKAYSTLIMWIVYFILSVYFYISWKKSNPVSLL